MDESCHDIPIFDSLAHPTLTGDWLGKHLDAGFERLSSDLRAANFLGCCAVGMANDEGYNHLKYMSECLNYSEMVPIAGIDPTSVSCLDKELDNVKELGYRGIKIHPRFFSDPLNFSQLPSVFKQAARRDLVVFYCTYMHVEIRHALLRSPYYILVEALQHAPEVTLVLVHGGDVELLKYAELARFSDNLLLDLSLTLMKYEGSSIDLDLNFLFRSFDRKICIGTDHPEYSHAQVRQRFEQFAIGVSREKLENIAHGNVMKILGVA